MTSGNSKRISIFNKTVLFINIFLFGITGFIYYMDDMHVVAYVLGGIGFINLIWSLFTIPVRNIFFVILNFIYTGIAIYLAVDLQIADSPYFAMFWFALALIYLMFAFVVLIKIKGGKGRIEKEKQELVLDEKPFEEEEEDVSLNNMLNS